MLENGVLVLAYIPADVLTAGVACSSIAANGFTKPYQHHHQEVHVHTYMCMHSRGGADGSRHNQRCAFSLHKRCTPALCIWPTQWVRRQQFPRQFTPSVGPTS